MDSLVVCNLDTGFFKKFEISQEEIKNNLYLRSILVKSLDLEITYDQIIEAYFDFKNKVNYWNLRSISSPDSGYILNHEIRGSLNRLSFNVLNLGKLYLDNHFNNEKRSCFAFDLTENQNVKNEIELHRKQVYDTNLHYVVACKLRGYSQHGELPVRCFTTGIRYDQDSLNKTSTFNIYYKYEDLIKMNVPIKLLSKNIKLDLISIIDGFVLAISEKHMLNRKLTNKVVNDSKVSLLSIWEGYSDKVDFKNNLMEIQMEDEQMNLSLEWFDVYYYLQSKHECSIDYSKIRF